MFLPANSERRGNELQPTRNFIDFALFVSFFPQLVAGPIERAKRLIPQVCNPRVLSYEGFRQGAWLVLFGFYKKVVLADNMAPFVDEIFNDPSNAYGLAVPLSVVAFALQIYGDFSGYSDIARGVSKMMGFDLMLNFRMPYFSTNPQEFWKRWHISLSTWLRDYLYIPLGGSRHGAYGTYKNLALTMLLGGLWHGAAWNFVAWGAYQGLLLIVHRLLVAKRSGSQSAIRRILMTGSFFIWTCIGWLLFRVNHLSDVPLLAQRMIAPFSWNGKMMLASIILFGLPVLLIDYFQERSGDMMVVKQWPKAARLLCYLFFFAAILSWGVIENRAFIYFQF